MTDLQHYAKARRGCLAVVERQRNAVSISPPSFAKWSEYLPATIVSVTRDGSVKLVKLYNDIPLKADRVVGWSAIWVTDLPAAPIMAALGNASWKSLDEARAAIAKARDGAVA